MLARRHFLSVGLTGEGCASRLIQAVGRIPFLAAEWMRFLSFYWLLAGAGGCPQVLEAAHSSLPCGPLHWQLTVQLFDSSRPAGKSPSGLLRSSLIYRHHGSAIHHLCLITCPFRGSGTHHLSHILLARFKSQVMPTFKWRGLYREWKPGKRTERELILII